MENIHVCFYVKGSIQMAQYNSMEWCQMTVRYQISWA